MSCKNEKKNLLLSFTTAQDQEQNVHRSDSPFVTVLHVWSLHVRIPSNDNQTGETENSLHWIEN